MNDQSNLPTQRQESSPVEVLKGHLTKRADEFRMVLPQHITPEKFQRVIATAAIQNPSLLTCDRQSLLLASMKLAQDALLPDGREAALVPFKSRVKGNDGKYYDKWLVQPMPMAYGLRKKILQSGEVLSLETGVVYLADYQSGRFIYEVGQEPPIRYRPDLLLPIEETTDDKIVAAYSIAKIKNDAGGPPYWSVEVMRRAEIDKVRQSSQTGAVGRVVAFGSNKGNPIQPKGPWVDWFGEMARKTVLRRHAKVLPMSGNILETFERDIEAERAADSAAAYLTAEERAPVTLPSSDDLNGQQGETIDHATGEVIQTNPATGMTEVDEETARALDAGDPGPQPEYDDTPLDPHRGQPWAEKRREIIDRLHEAENMVDFNSTVARFTKDVRAMPDEVRAEIEQVAERAKAAFAQRSK